VSEHWTFRLGDLLGSGGPCAFLRPEEIEALARGRLGHERRSEFDRHAKDCRACAGVLEELAQFESIIAGGGVPSELRSFRATDSEARKRLGIAPRRDSRRIGFVLVPALAAALLILLFLVPMGESPVLIPEIEPLRFAPPPPTRGISLHEAWQEALDAWNADDFHRAAEVLEQGLRVEPERADLLFYLGYARLRLGENAAALEALSRTDALQQATPSEHTRWFLAAALERARRHREACESLRSVVEIGGLRAERAAAIVDRACDGGH